MSTLGELGRPELTLRRKILGLNWTLILLIAAIAAIGFAMLYSVGGGSLEPWSVRQMMRFVVGLALMIAIAVVDIRIWLRLAYPIYFLALGLLGLVEVSGRIGMGAQRWIDLGFFQLQPSELMKVALVLSLAAYYHGLKDHEVSRPSRLILPLLLIGVPVALIVRQPDLGTALLIVLGSTAILYLAGVSWRYFAAAGLAGVLSVPLAWKLVLHDYQRERILTFLNPERDPLGAGYHILQSKIALGSGGTFGKGFLLGTQSHLDFLPEMRTDFIFTTLAEEFGLVGGLSLLALYFIVIVYGFATSLQVRSQFGRLVVMGITANFFLYVFINVAMVMGLIPVVGVPLPFVSYGGTAMMTLMVAFGLLMSAHVYREVEIPRVPGGYGWDS